MLMSVVIYADVSVDLSNPFSILLIVFRFMVLILVLAMFVRDRIEFNIYGS